MSHDHQGPVKEPIGWMDKPDVVKRLFMIIYVISVLLLIAEFVLGRENAHSHPWEGMPLFYAVYGFVSFWFLVLVAKPMRKLLIRSEDYYEGGGRYSEDSDAE
jgi:phosphatidylserine synthase